MKILILLTTLFCFNPIDSLYFSNDPQYFNVEVYLKNPMHVPQFEIWRRELNNPESKLECFKKNKGPSYPLKVIVVPLNLNELDFEYSICIVEEDKRHFSKLFKYSPKMEGWFLSSEFN